MCNDSSCGHAYAGNNIELIENYLNAVRLGTYSRNHAIIHLSRDASYWFRENEPTLQRLSVFIHEYVHYLHNFSTIAGIYDFVAQLRMTGAFMQSVGVEGLSKGIQEIGSEAKAHFESSCKWQYHLRGDDDIPPSFKPVSAASKIALLEIERGNSLIKFPNQEISVYNACAKLKIDMGSFNVGQTEITLGSSIILEGLAWEIERLLYLNNTGSTNELDGTFPSTPYKLCRLLFESITGKVPTSSLMAKICLLALQSSDPGANFIAIASAFSQQHNNETDDDILENVTTEVTRTLKTNMSSLIDKFLTPEFATFKNLKTVRAGLSQLEEHCTQYISLRVRNPFFELDLIDKGMTRDALLSLLRTHPPCPIMHNDGFTPNEKALIIINESEQSDEAISQLGAYQCFMQFSSQHFVKPCGFVETSKLPTRACMFYGVCTAPLTKDEPNICLNKPWESFSKNATAPEICWYAYGVSATRTRTD